VNAWDGKPTLADFERYAFLVQQIRKVQGLAPLPNVLPVDDPRPFNAHMEQQLREVGVLR
jgi:hypothetical protein